MLKLKVCDIANLSVKSEYKIVVRVKVTAEDGKKFTDEFCFPLYVNKNFNGTSDKMILFNLACPASEFVIVPYLMAYDDVPQYKETSKTITQVTTFNAFINSVISQHFKTGEKVKVSEYFVTMTNWNTLKFLYDAYCVDEKDVEYLRFVSEGLDNF